MELSDARSLLRLEVAPPTAKNFGVVADARRWLERELPNVLGVARLAAELGLHRQTCLMTRAVSPLSTTVRTSSLRACRTAFVTASQAMNHAAASTSEANLSSGTSSTTGPGRTTAPAERGSRLTILAIC